jgi:inward rectifier potassium channel
MAQPAVSAPVPPPILIGEPRAVMRDAYHGFLRMSWTASILSIAAGFMALNLAFAVVYYLLGGIANARAGSFLDMLYFSVQTTATIGYGSMYPATDLTNFVVMAESAAALIVTALATGLVFAKFSRTTARVQFSKLCVVTPVDGVPTLMLRIGNERGNTIVGAQVRLVLNRLERTLEGERFYRFYDLRLTRDHAPALSRAWTVMHTIDATSPLAGVDTATLTEWDAELTVSISGLDDLTMQQLHASHSYDIPDIRWNAKLATMITPHPSGTIVVNLHKFHDVEELARPSGSEGP